MLELTYSNLIEQSLEHNVPFSMLVLGLGEKDKEPDEIYFIFNPEQAVEVQQDLFGRVSPETAEELSHLFDAFEGYEHSTMKLRHYTGEEGVLHAFFGHVIVDLFEEMRNEDDESADDEEPDEEEEMPLMRSPKRSRSDLPN